MYVEEVRLISFKGFQDFTITCSPFTCLVGLNSRGKTSILQAIRLLHDILVFAFGNGERPDYSNPQWQSNPSYGLNRLALGDPDALWLHKRTSEPCKIVAKCTGDVTVALEVAGRSRYALDVLIKGMSIRSSMKEPANQAIITELFSLFPMYVPPIGTISPMETLLWQPQMIEYINQGRDAECWRSRLHWLYNDGDKESFVKLVELVQRYLPEAKILPPRMTHDQPARVLIEFEEGTTVLDISTSGGGLRTLLNLATVLHFSRSRCLLCDEPDAHLHASLQRAIARMLLDFSAERNCQVFVATHAADFVAELPVESIVWVDRSHKEGLRCGQLGKVLADLGAVSKADAVRACGADKILFVEGSMDKTVLSDLFGRTDKRNPFKDDKVIIAFLPGGKGTASQLHMFRELLRESLHINVTVACITDNDYDLLQKEDSQLDGSGDALLLSLGRKEVENYLIDPVTVASAIGSAGRERLDRTGNTPAVPDNDAVRAQLENILQMPEMRDTVRWQLVPQYRDGLDRKLAQSSREQLAEQWFAERWNDPAWRVRNCPGKQVLKALRTWCQTRYGLTLSTGTLVASVPECPPDVVDIAGKIEAHFYGNKTGALTERTLV